MNNILLAIILILLLLWWAYLGSTYLPAEKTVTSPLSQWSLTGSNQQQIIAPTSSGVSDDLQKPIELSIEQQVTNMQAKYLEAPSEFRFQDFGMSLLYDDILKEWLIAEKNGSLQTPLAFLNTQLWENRTPEICDNTRQTRYCQIIRTFRTQSSYTLEDITHLLYALAQKEISYSDFETVMSQPKKLNFPNLTPDLVYSHYYAAVITGRIKTTSDLFNFVITIWSIQ